MNNHHKISKWLPSSNLLQFGTTYYSKSLLVYKKKPNFYLSLNKPKLKNKLKWLQFSKCNYPIICGTVGAPQTSWPPVPSSPLCSLPSSGFLPVPFPSTHLFLCLHLLLCPRSVPCRTVSARPDALVVSPYHLSFQGFTVVKCLYRPQQLDVVCAILLHW